MHGLAQIGPGASYVGRPRRLRPIRTRCFHPRRPSFSDTNTALSLFDFRRQISSSRAFVSSKTVPHVGKKFATFALGGLMSHSDDAKWISYIAWQTSQTK
jgi:hypothetical protein